MMGCLRPQRIQPGLESHTKCVMHFLAVKLETIFDINIHVPLAPSGKPPD